MAVPAEYVLYTALITGGLGAAGVFFTARYAAMTADRRLAFETRQAEVTRGDALVRDRRRVYVRFVKSCDELAPLLRAHKVTRADFAKWWEAFQDTATVAEVVGDAKVSPLASKMREAADALRIKLSDRPHNAAIGWSARWYWFGEPPPAESQVPERFAPPSLLPSERFEQCRDDLMTAIRGDLRSDDPPRPPLPT